MNSVVAVNSSKDYDFCYDAAEQIGTFLRQQYPNSFITYCISFKVANLDTLIKTLQQERSEINYIAGYGNCLAKVLKHKKIKNNPDLLIRFANQKELEDEIGLILDNEQDD